MITFLDNNYLHDAVQQRRNFLSQCMLTVPSYLKHSYPHKGELEYEDTKYRLLWKKTKANVEFLHDECQKQLVDVDKLVFWAGDEFQYEPFDINKPQNNSFDECVDFNLGSDMIPSSSPDSPDLFFNDDLATDSSNIFQDIYKKEELPWVSSTNDCLKLETCLNSSDDGERLNNQLPNLSKLKSRLKPLAAPDPLSYKDGDIINEKNFFKAPLLFSFDEPKTSDKQLDIHIVDDPFEKQDISHCSNIVALEDVFTYSIELQQKEDIYFALTTTLGIKLKSLGPMMIEKDEGLKKYVNNNVNQEDIKYSSCKMIPYKLELLDEDEVTFLEINEPNIDKISEEATLDTPLSATPDLHTELYLPECRPVELSQTTPKFLDQKKISCLKNMCLLSELYCNEIQAYRLAEPYNLEAETEIRISESHTEQVRMVANLEKQTTASVELQLPWDITKVSDFGKDPTYSFEKLQIDKTTVVVDDITEVFVKSCLAEFTENEPEEYEEESEVESFDNADITEEEFKQVTMSPQDGRTNEKETVEVLNDEKVKSINETFAERHVYNENQTADKPRDGMDYVTAKPPTVSGVGFDPLGDFMALRSRQYDTVSENDYKAVHKSEVLPNKAEETLSHSGLKQVLVKRRKSKHHLVTVRLSDSYQALMSVLENAASTYLTILKSSDNITRSCTFQSLTPDITKFLIKQREKYQQDNDIEATEDGTYRNILCVHGLVGAAEILVRCCLEPALGFLNAMQDRYKNTLQNSLATVHQTLLQMKEKLTQQQIYHPKMTALCKEIEVWLKKKRAKSGDNEQKILIIVKTNIPSLMNNLKKVVGQSNLLQPEITQSTESDALIESLDVHNCVIIYTNHIRDTFPWAQFSLVVEYECQDKFEWKDHCERQNIRHMALKIEKEPQEDQSAGNNWNLQCNGKQISLIASQQVTGNSKLLQLLESRFNIQLYERDYSLLVDYKKCSFSDVDIDENTGLILEDVTGLKDDWTLHTIVTRIIALSLKYSTCFCLLYTKERLVTAGYQFPSHAVGNLCKLQAAIVNFEVKNKTTYRTKIVICPNVHEVAVTIRQICEETLANTKNKTEEEWLNRTWLTLDLTQEERFLLQNPHISSFNAQLLVKEMGIKRIMNCSLAELVQSVPGILKTTLAMFHESLHQQHQNPWDDSQQRSNDFSAKPVNAIGKTHKSNTEIMPDMSHSDSEGSQSPTQVEDNAIIVKGVSNLPSQASLTVNKKRLNVVDSKQISSSQQKTAQHKEQFCDREMQDIDETGPKSVISRAHRIYPENIIPTRKMHTYGFTPTSDSKSLYQHVTASWSNKQDQRSDMLHSRQRRLDELNNTVLQINSLQSRPKSAKRQLQFESRNLTKAEQSFRDFCGSNKNDENENLQKKETVFEHNAEYRDDDNGAARSSYYEVNGIQNIQQNMMKLPDQSIDLNTDQSLHQIVMRQPVQTTDINSEQIVIHIPEQTTCFKTDQNLYQNVIRHPVQSADGNKEQNRIGEALPVIDVNTIQNLHQIVNRQPVQTFDYNHGLSHCNTESLQDESYQPLEHTLPEETFFRRRQTIPLIQDYLHPSKISTSNRVDSDQMCVVNFQRENTASLAAKKLKLPGNTMPDFQNMNYQMASYDQEKSVDHYRVSQGPLHHVKCRRTDADPDSYNGQLSNGRDFRENFAPAIIEKQQLPEMAAKHSVNDYPVSSTEGEKHLTPYETEKGHGRNTDSNIQVASMSRSSNLNEVFTNPGIQRISLRPNWCLLEREEGNNYLSRNNFEDELRVATRRFLQSSETLPRFGLDTSRYPIHKRSIGLAQPLQRQQTSVTENQQERRSEGEVLSIWSNEEKKKMEQSPWATDNSPPMDLDYEDSQINNLLNLHQDHPESTNRSVFTGQTPKKKARLTYQKIPGKKGQTKLLFQ